MRTPPIAMTSDLIPYKYAKQLKILKRVKSKLPYEYATVVLKFDDTSLCERQGLPYEYARCSTKERERYEKRKRRKKYDFPMGTQGHRKRYDHAF